MRAFASVGGLGDLDGDAGRGEQARELRAAVARAQRDHDDVEVAAGGVRGGEAGDGQGLARAAGAGEHERRAAEGARALHRDAAGERLADEPLELAGRAERQEVRDGLGDDVGGERRAEAALDERELLRVGLDRAGRSGGRDGSTAADAAGTGSAGAAGSATATAGPGRGRPWRLRGRGRRRGGGRGRGGRLRQRRVGHVQLLGERRGGLEERADRRRLEALGDRRVGGLDGERAGGQRDAGLEDRRQHRRAGRTGGRGGAAGAATPAGG